MSRRQSYWNEYKTKSDNKNQANEFRYFIESSFAGINRLFFIIYAKKAKRFDARKYYLQKGQKV